MRFWHDVGGFANTELIIPFWKVKMMALRQEKAGRRGVNTHESLSLRTHYGCQALDRIPTATLNLGGSVDSGFITASGSVFPSFSRCIPQHYAQ